MLEQVISTPIKLDAAGNYRREFAHPDRLEADEAEMLLEEVADVLEAHTTEEVEHSNTVVSITFYRDDSTGESIEYFAQLTWERDDAGPKMIYCLTIGRAN